MAVTMLINLSPTVHVVGKRLLVDFVRPRIVRWWKALCCSSTANHEWLTFHTSNLIMLRRRAVYDGHSNLGRCRHCPSIEIAGKALINAFVVPRQTRDVQRAVADKENVWHTTEWFSVFLPVIATQSFKHSVSDIPLYNLNCSQLSRFLFLTPENVQKARLLIHQWTNNGLWAASGSSTHVNFLNLDSKQLMNKILCCIQIEGGPKKRTVL